jgi:hypothetical protein
MVQITKGILAGLNLRELGEADLIALSQSTVRTELTLSSFYKGSLKGFTVVAR